MCHVLIIEDDVVAAFDIRDTLKTVGATSFAFAESSRQALASAREQRPGVITSDVMLTDGSGPAAVRAILEELGQVAVIFITATPDQCDDHAAHPVIEKPFSPQRLTAAFQAVAPI